MYLIKKEKESNNGKREKEKEKVNYMHDRLYEFY